MDMKPLTHDLFYLFPVYGNGNIIVVSGWRGVGKTTYCQQAVDEYRKAGLIVSGLLSPSRFDSNHRKNGFFALDLTSYESRLVASLIPNEFEGIQFGSWTFDPKVFDWGNQCLQQAIGADVLVIDELGFLEFDLKIGWTASFDILRRKNYRLAIVVIRPECIDVFSSLGFSFQVKEVFSL
jgi:nucleoside-triphosphatase THEP1